MAKTPRNARNLPAPEVVNPLDIVDMNVIASRPRDLTADLPNDTINKSTQKGQTMINDDELGSIIEFTDDIDDAEAPLPLPEGQYEAEIKAVEAKMSGNNKRYAAVSFYIPTDAFPADYPLEEAPDGLVLIYRKLSLENNKMSKFNLKRFIQNIGAPPVGRSLDLTQWVGLRAKIVIKHDTWEGTKRATVDKVVASS
jgi:hypothetical protein